MEKRTHFTAMALVLVAASFTGLAHSAGSDPQVTGSPAPAYVPPAVDSRGPVVTFPAPPANLAG